MSDFLSQVYETSFDSTKLNGDAVCLCPSCVSEVHRIESLINDIEVKKSSLCNQLLKYVDIADPSLDLDCDSSEVHVADSTSSQMPQPILGKRTHSMMVSSNHEVAALDNSHRCGAAYTSTSAESTSSNATASECQTTSTPTRPKRQASGIGVSL